MPPKKLSANFQTLGRRLDGSVVPTAKRARTKKEDEDEEEFVPPDVESSSDDEAAGAVISDEEDNDTVDDEDLEADVDSEAEDGCVEIRQGDGSLRRMKVSVSEAEARKFTSDLKKKYEAEMNENKQRFKVRIAIAIVRAMADKDHKGKEIDCADNNNNDAKIGSRAIEMQECTYGLYYPVRKKNGGIRYEMYSEEQLKKMEAEGKKMGSEKCRCDICIKREEQAGLMIKPGTSRSGRTRGFGEGRVLGESEASKGSE